jgi:hypothetical protein
VQKPCTALIEQNLAPLERCKGVKVAILFERCKVRLGAKTLHRSNRTKPCTALKVQRLGVGMCKAISVKSAVQKSAVGGAKNGGRGLEKKPYPV